MRLHSVWKPGILPILQRRQSAGLFKRPGKVTAVREAAGKRDLRDRVIGFIQK